jgi:hypothetical protein
MRKAAGIANDHWKTVLYTDPDDFDVGQDWCEGVSSAILAAIPKEK